MNGNPLNSIGEVAEAVAARLEIEVTSNDGLWVPWQVLNWSKSRKYRAHPRQPVKIQSKDSEMELLKKIEGYGFDCEAGPLSKCVDWEALKTAVDLWVVTLARSDAPVMHTSGHGGWRFTAHTNQEEAQATADAMNREAHAGQPLFRVRHLLSITEEKELTNPAMKKVKSLCWRHKDTGDLIWRHGGYKVESVFYQRFPAGDREGEVEA